jgi:competence protein ComEC
VVILSLGALIGALLVHHAATLATIPLPPVGATLLALPCIAFCWRVGGIGRGGVAVALGALWTLLWAHNGLEQGLPAHTDSASGWIEGSVVGLPDRFPDGIRFELRVDAWDPRLALPPRALNIRLFWRDDHNLLSGDRWRLQVRLRRPLGFASPGAFDYEGYCFRRRIAALGYVLPSAANQRLSRARFTLHGIRARIAENIAEQLAGHPSAALITALSLGIRTGISQRQQETLIRTGTSHLLAISGLHVGIITALSFFFARWLGSAFNLWLDRLAAQRFAALVALLCASVYAMLAGFSLPTQRALIMAAIVLGRCAAGLPPWSASGLAIALLLILLWDPLAPLEPGFWLSFAAVLVIMVALIGRKGSGWRRWGRMQLIVSVGLAPLTALWFGTVSIVAPLANTLAVPWVSILVAPLTLGGVALSAVGASLGNWLLTSAATLLDWLMVVLAWLGKWQLAQVPVMNRGPIACLAVFIGLLILAAPAGLPGRWLGLAVLLAVLVPFRGAPPYGSYDLHLLDVGQGLSAVVRTERHTLVYDLGPRFSPRLNTGSAVVMPFLRHQGIRTVDVLVVSHGDIDHRGGLEGLTGQIPLLRVLSSTPGSLEGVASELCQYGQSWRWDGVRFEMLHPSADRPWSGNNASCVLRISNDQRAVLLTGDIEAEAELGLAGKAAERLRADVLIAPHHGSRSSSSRAFIAKVHPQLVIPAGRANRYRFPHLEAVRAYRLAGAPFMSTGDLGTLSLRIADTINFPRAARQQRRRYWQRLALP